MGDVKRLNKRDRRRWMYEICAAELQVHLDQGTWMNEFDDWTAERIEAEADDFVRMLLRKAGDDA